MIYLTPIIVFIQGVVSKHYDSEISSIPRQIECYSCMSLSYQTSWKFLQATYIYPKNHCRTLSRAHLFNPARASDPPAIGDVQLCSCYGDRCNGSNSASLVLYLLPLLAALFRLR